MRVWGSLTVHFNAGAPEISKQNGVVSSVADTATGVVTITLDGGGIDESEAYCVVTPKGTAAAVPVISHTSDTVKVVRLFTDAGAAVDQDFDLLIFTYGSN
jgi:hypothetical protein